MYNNSSRQPQPQIASAGHDNSRPSTDTPSSTSARQVGPNFVAPEACSDTLIWLQLDTTVQENLIQDARNQSRAQSNIVRARCVLVVKRLVLTTRKKNIEGFRLWAPNTPPAYLPSKLLEWPIPSQRARPWQRRG